MPQVLGSYQQSRIKSRACSLHLALQCRSNDAGLSGLTSGFHAHLTSDTLLASSLASGMLRVLRRPDQLSVLGRSLTSSVVASGRSEKCDIPAGHQNSDLRNVTCHIGLNRRRDLSLREDLCLFQPGGKATVGEIFKVSTARKL